MRVKGTPELTLFRWSLRHVEVLSCTHLVQVISRKFWPSLAKLCASAEGRSLVKQKEYRSPCTRQRVVIGYSSLVTYLHDILSTEDDRVLVLLM